MSYKHFANYSLGKHPKKTDRRTLQLARYMPMLPTPPAKIDHASKLPANIGMMGNDQYGDCLSAETRVLTADLRWVEIGSVKVGDKLVGFDEHASGGNFRKGRQYRTAVVERVEPMMKPCFDLVFADGTKIRASFDHQWLRRWRGGVGRESADSMWLRTERMRAGGQRPTRLAKCFATWSDDQSFDAGYLAAAFDGEGCYARSPIGTMKSVNFTQKPNIMLSAVAKMLQDRGFRTEHARQQYSTLSASGYDVLRVGHRQQVARLLGSIRPKRLLSSFEPEQLGGMQSEKIDLVEKLDVGMQPVIAVQTSTRTFIAEGFASHNCTVAAAGHMIQSWSIYGGDLKMDTPSDADILAAYKIVSPNDNGANMLDVLNLWRKTGVGTDKIEGFVEVAPADLVQAKLAIQYFGSIYVGMSLPDTNTFGPWDVAQPSWPPDYYNGHAVNLCAYDDATKMFRVCTWGEVWNLSYGWYQKYVDECYAVLNDIELLQSTGKSPEGFDWTALVYDLSHIGDPVVDPTPTPPPTPTTIGSIVLTAKHSSDHWFVYLNGTAQTPGHTDQLEAVQHADRLRYANQKATIELRNSAVYAVTSAPVAHHAAHHEAQPLRATDDHRDRH